MTWCHSFVAENPPMNICSRAKRTEELLLRISGCETAQRRSLYAFDSAPVTQTHDPFLLPAPCHTTITRNMATVCLDAAPSGLLMLSEVALESEQCYLKKSRVSSKSRAVSRAKRANSRTSPSSPPSLSSSSSVSSDADKTIFSPPTSPSPSREQSGIEASRLVEEAEDCSSQPLSKQRFNCDIEGCNQTFATKFSWRRHRKKHTGERPWGCVYCLRYFGEKSTLKKHLHTHSQFHQDKKEAPWFSVVAMNAGTKLANSAGQPGQSLSAMSLAKIVLGQKDDEEAAEAMQMSEQKHSEAPLRAVAVSDAVVAATAVDPMAVTLSAAARHLATIHKSNRQINPARHHPYSRSSSTSPTVSRTDSETFHASRPVTASEPHSARRSSVSRPSSPSSAPEMARVVSASVSPRSGHVSMAGSVSPGRRSPVPAQAAVVVPVPAQAVAVPFPAQAVAVPVQAQAATYKRDFQPQIPVQRQHVTLATMMQYQLDVIYMRRNCSGVEFWSVTRILNPRKMVFIHCLNTRVNQK
eukprot:g68124.t1